MVPTLKTSGASASVRNIKWKSGTRKIFIILKCLFLIKMSHYKFANVEVWN